MWLVVLPDICPELFSVLAWGVMAQREGALELESTPSLLHAPMLGLSVQTYIAGCKDLLCVPVAVKG